MSTDKEFINKLRMELISKRFVTEKEFCEFLEEHERKQESLIEILYHSRRMDEKELVKILSHIFGYPPINIATFVVDVNVLKLIPKELAKKYQALPISRFEKTLTVAIADPTNLADLDDLRALAGLRIKPVLAAPSQLTEAFQKYYKNGEGGLSAAPSSSFEEIIETVRLQVLNKTTSLDSGDLSDLLEAANATPVVRLVNHLLIGAIRRKASDIFIEPLEKNMRVRYRVDGILEEIIKAPYAFVNPVISRIKVMSRLNIAEHRVPQDGRFKVRISGPEVDLRVSILPTCFGEKACLRILDPGAETQKLEQLGFSPEQLDTVRRLATKPHGMILVTGPTGSGKTTTLYAALQFLNSAEKNITTVEDPVEYQMTGINQVNVREQVGLTFPVALRSILRQDPDIILIGEIRDLVTMDIAVKAALTGHLVLSTLHTNDSTSAIVRMINMGIEPFLIASSVLMISAQRLVRKLCTFCRTSYSPEQELLESLNLPPKEKFTFYRPKGCERCRFMGYKSRTVITELFEMKPAILDHIVKGGPNDELRGLAREMGMTTLRENGVLKVKEGITAAEEVLRVTSPEKSCQAQGV